MHDRRPAHTGAMSPLTDYEERLVVLFTGIVLGRWEDVRAVRKEAPAGEPDRGWREAVLQAHLFAGFPRVVEAFEVLDRVGGLGTPDPSELDLAADNAAGEKLFSRIYEDHADAVRDRLAEHHADFGRWIHEHAYARVLSRPGLDPHTRELLAVAALTATAQTRQLASHTKGALRCGATPAQIHAVLDAIETRISYDALRAARQVILKYAPLDEDTSHQH